MFSEFEAIFAIVILSILFVKLFIRKKNFLLSLHIVTRWVKYDQRQTIHFLVKINNNKDELQLKVLFKEF